MAHIKITRGLDIPIKGKPTGKIETLFPSGGADPARPQLIALDLKPFEEIKFRLLTKVGDTVKIGQALAEDKSLPERMFCSPAGGIVKEIRRGLKRCLTEIIIETAAKEEYSAFTPLIISEVSREQIIDRLNNGGLFTHIRSRPFNLLADPHKIPRNIFVKAIESAPFVPPAELQVEGQEGYFQDGLNALAKLTSGSVHLIYRKDTSCKAFSEARGVKKHTAEGPHPISNSSVHIQSLDPIRGPDDIVWTLTAHDVVSIGYLLTKGHMYIERVVSIAGPGVLPDRTGFFKTREGIPVSQLISGRMPKQGTMRLVSGDPLMGKQVGPGDFLGFNHYAFSIIPEGKKRQFLHFFRLGFNKYSFSKAYASGHLDNSHREYDFTTNQHGEHRAFIDSSLYDEVMPLPVSTMLLVKAIMAEDYELAEQLGLLTVDSEDFALPTFVCPSKMEMTETIKQGLKQYAHDFLL